ncbi:MAG: calcium/sodium antiporter [Pseudobdellovibrionaceae bacterium]
MSGESLVPTRAALSFCVVRLYDDSRQTIHQRIAVLNDILLIGGGLFLLLLGGEGILRGSVAVATRLGVSKFLVAAVIIGFGTSMPEMAVSVEAALQNAPEVALGNVVGSNIANVLLIVGLSAVISPIALDGDMVRRDMAFMLVATLVLCALAYAGAFHGVSGAVMLVGLLVYIWWSYRLERSKQSQLPSPDADGLPDAPIEAPMRTGKAVILSVASLVMLVGGAVMLVDGAIALARHFAISETVIGLTIIAVGTSLPEIATSVVSSLRHQGDVVIGNILGSNIFNILAILAVTAMIKDIPVSEQIVAFDMWVMLGAAFVLALFLLLGVRIGRRAGFVMLASYSAYIFFLYALGS